MWKTHKGTFFQLIKTLIVLFVIILIKKGLARLIPEALKLKIKSVILWKVKLFLINSIVNRCYLNQPHQYYIINVIQF